MTDDELRQLFPAMRPIKRPPPLHTINGFGTRVYGHRDLDRASGAYVTTLCLCALFVPLFCLRAYRVVRASSGWYFLGREPLSTPAKAWNLAVLGLAVGSVGIASLAAYMATDAYKAHRRMDEARAYAAEGRPSDAARIYLQLAAAGKDEAPAAAAALNALVEAPPPALPLAEQARVFAVAARAATVAGCHSTPDLVARALALVAARGQADPKGALALLDVLRPLAIDPRALDTVRLPLLQALVAAEPANLDAAVALADLLLEQNQHAPAKALLAPFKGRLGDSEGARVLGLLYARDGAIEDAYALLQSYVKPRLDRLHAAERDSAAAAERGWNAEIQRLQQNDGPADLYAKLEHAAEADRESLVREYVTSRLKDNPDLLAAQEDVAREGRVIPVTLELGLVMLQRAHAQTDPAARTRQLEAAQDVFLSIRSFAGESDEYRLFLGQVYYWLGKHADGRKLFDDLLAAKGRSSLALAGIANTLRQLGADAEARTLAEEAVAKANSADERTSAALLRSSLFTDTDDQIAWLLKCDQTNPNVRAPLALARANKAAADGRDADAAAQFRAAIAAYAALPRGLGTLNQTALAYSALFRLTGDPQDQAKCLDCIQAAIDLDPSDAILLFNSASIVLQDSLTDILSPALDLKALHRPGDLSLLRYLYRDSAGRAALLAKVAAHPGVQRARAYLDKSMLVSPKSARPYALAHALETALRNDAALASLADRVAAAALEDPDALRDADDYRRGDADARLKPLTAAALRRLDAAAVAARPAGGPTAAAALAEHATALARADALLPVADPAGVVARAEAAHAAAPSDGTAAALSMAYAFHAAADCRKQDPQFDAFYRRHARSFGPYYLLAAIAGDGGPFFALVTGHPDFQKLLALRLDRRTRFPEDAAGADWALFRRLRPVDSTRVADILRASPTLVRNQQTAARVHPASAAEPLELYWDYLALGRQADARQALQPLIDRGIPLPVTP
jgi:hypothetical protein